MLLAVSCAARYTGLWLCSIALVLQLIYRPYINVTQDRMETFSLSMLVAAMLASLPLSMSEESVGPRSRGITMWVVCALLVAMMAGLLAVFTRELGGQVKEMMTGGGGDVPKAAGDGAADESERGRKSTLETYQTPSGRFGAINPMQTSERAHAMNERVAAAVRTHDEIVHVPGAKDPSKMVDREASLRSGSSKRGHI